MRATLPIPEQPGFKTRLPAAVALASGTQTQASSTNLSLTRNGLTISVQIDAAARAALLSRLSAAGPGMATDRLSATWRQLLERLANAGMLVSAQPCVASGPIPAVDALSAVHDAIYDETLLALGAEHVLNRMITGSLAANAGKAWLVENYYYTKSAAYHIAPVLGHEMEINERNLWSRFLKDESWHWRIYRPALTQFGLSFSSLDQGEPHRATQRFVNVLRDAALAGPTVYAAVMIFIEKPPLDDLESDQLFGSLLRHYGFTADGIKPLWWHATENLKAGHSDLGAAVITNRGALGRGEVDGMVSAARTIVREVSKWNTEILGAY